MNFTPSKLKRFIAYYVIFLMVSVTIVGFFFLPSHSEGPDPPIHLHLTWQNDTNSSITITWQTALIDSGDIVLYDAISRGGNVSLYLYNATGINYTYTGASGYIHDVELTGLSPDTEYYFICGGVTGGFSEERSFRTAPIISSDVRFVAGGDSRSDPVEREKISQAMAKFDPAFVIHTGDMVADGNTQSLWDTWFTDVDSNWLTDNNRTIPIIPAIGNHEGNSEKYYKQFALPNNEMWYSYNWGPDIHIVVLSTETTTSGAQRDWLESDLANYSDCTWKFVAFHQPPFPATRPTGHAGAIADFVPLFDKYHVDIVFLGHDHAYLRTKAINWTDSQTEAQPYANGTMYIVTGGWGAPLYTLLPHWYDAYGLESYHFCLVDVFKNGSLHLQAKNDLGDTIDEVWLIKNESLDLGVAIEMTSLSIHNALPIDLTWNATGIIDHYKVFIDGEYKQYLASIEKAYQITSLAEGNHTIIVGAYDPLGNSINTTQILSYDATPPITSDDYDGLWHSEDFIVTLNATDNLLGVAETYYRINDGPIRNLNADGNPNITTEGATNKLEYWSIDMANNEELPHSILMSLKLDKTQPIADAGGNQTIEKGTMLIVNGNLSIDNVAIANYTWTFIDITPQIYFGVNFSYQFDNLGIFEISLNISDYTNRWDTDKVWITVIDSSPPVADASSNMTILVGAIYKLNASGSSDNVGIANYTWTFIDITPKTYFGVTFDYQFNNLGIFEITLNVSDYAGNWDTDKVWITVIDSSPPVANAGFNISIIVGDVIIFNASRSYDNVGIVNYTWDFGDGIIISSGIPIINHIYNETGIYKVTLIVEDAAGNSASTTIFVTVEGKKSIFLWEIVLFLGLFIFTIISIRAKQKDVIRASSIRE